LRLPVNSRPSNSTCEAQRGGAGFGVSASSVARCEAGIVERSRSIVFGSSCRMYGPFFSSHSRRLDSLTIR
jgi:hypothetical protein